VGVGCRQGGGVSAGKGFYDKPLSEDEVADPAIARFLAGDGPRRKKSPLTGWRVGNKEKHPKPIPTTRSTDPEWREKTKMRRQRPGRGVNASGLPTSGAPFAPKQRVNRKRGA